MTRSNDKKLARDQGQTLDQLLSDGFVLAVAGRMQKGTSTKRKCDNCGRWFDEVFPIYIDSVVCAFCRKQYAKG